MFIIVEGPDGAGKTTLIKKLQAQFPNSKYLHFGVPEEPTKQYEMYLHAIETAGKYSDIIILDRCWYSDMVYAPIMRGTEDVTVATSRKLDAAIITYGGGIVIYCTAPIDVLWERCQTRGEDYVKDIETLQKLSQAYTAVMKQSLLPVITFNTAE